MRIINLKHLTPVTAAQREDIRENVTFHKNRVSQLGVHAVYQLFISH